MKVNPSVKPHLRQCKVIRRHGRVMVICKSTRATSSARASRQTLRGRTACDGLRHRHN